jgi:Co/Zn/Cd efflux system component
MNDIQQHSFRKILWIALIVNLTLCIIEIIASMTAYSVSLLGDALDFGGDSINYAISLMVMNMSNIWRSRAAMIKALCMLGFGIFILIKAYFSHINHSYPQPLTMGGIAVLALLANVSVAAILYKFRYGNANMQSVWLCSRNDVISNIAIFFAAIIVFYTKNNWADLLVAFVMASLAITSATKIIRLARKELSA